VSAKVAILCDFDGTIAERDVGHHFFGSFISDTEHWNELLERWKLGLISSRECLEHEFEMVRADRGDLDRFIAAERLDPFFKDFIDFCNRRRFEVLVVSDGLDYYINTMLMDAGLGYLGYRANRLEMNNGNLTGISFPHFNPMDCTRCANCKLHHLEAARQRGYFIVYVGNGYSDRCPAEHADLVFAKGDLLDHCTQENLDCIPFDNFRDVERELTTRFLDGE
jgi:2,3-diketo-5-methylthio-1-phosphopentane phosphatase